MKLISREEQLERLRRVIKCLVPRCGTKIFIPARPFAITFAHQELTEQLSQALASLVEDTAKTASLGAIRK